MSQVAILRWTWQAAGPLVTGYSQNLAEAAGQIERGQRSVINLQTRDASGELGPSFLASSVKGVFRSAAAWLVERTARAQGARQYVTCDYGLAVPDSWRKKLGIRKREDLCPVCRVFGGSGCLGESDVAPASRLKSPSSFGFNRADDGAHGSVKKSPPYRFAWEQVDNRGEKLTVEQLQFAPDACLEARLDPADEFGVALLLLAADLVSSGFFRLGRFTTRGYGVVRLQPKDYFYGSLMELLAAGATPAAFPPECKSGKAAFERIVKGGQALEAVAHHVRPEQRSNAA
jgi:hypothetical protein